jgi:large subunit ribosomal protein L6
MSRIGKNPIILTSSVEIKLENGVVTVKGPLGTLAQEVGDNINLSVEDGMINVNRPTESKEHKSKHGLYRSLISNMVVGVTQVYKTHQELVGVGYKAEAKEQILELNLGYSHNIYMQIPSEIKITTETVKGKNPTIIMESIDKQLIGQVAAKIRSFRKPEPYKGKGIKFTGEVLRKKAGKSASKK